VIVTKGGLSIGEAAQRLNLTEDTLRYYERVGLTPPVERDAGSGHRRYSEDDLRWFTFVSRMRATGMSIETLQRYAAFTREGQQTAAARRALLEEHRSKLQARIEELHDALRVVDKKIERLASGEAHKS
jgi:DNA-binding transcriptional MerR regulator